MTRQKPINRFIVDFYCSELSLVVEVDGGYHNVQKDNDRLRDEFLKKCGITTVRVSDKEVVNDIDKVRKKLKEFVINPCPVKGKGRDRV